MKILCNISSNNIGGVVNYLKGIVKAVEIDSDFMIVGIEVTKKPKVFNPDILGRIKYRPFVYPEFYKRDLFEDAKNYSMMAAKMRPIIDWMKKEIQHEKPDLLLLYGTFWVPWCLLKAAEELQVPVIHYYAGSLVLETLGYRKYQKNIFLRMERDFDSHSIKSHIFPSEIARRKIEREVYGKQLLNSVIIHSGIDTGYFIEKQESLNKIGFVFRWTEVKNTKMVLDLIRINKERGSILEFNIVTDLKETQKDYEIVSKDCNLIPPMDYEDLASFYSNCSVIVSPSNFETFGNVPLEAIFNGTPALINKNMGVAEIFQKLGLDDLIIKFDDPMTVFQHILDTQGRAIPVEVRNSIRERFSLEKIYPKYLDHIKVSLED